jgi:uncharacterized cupin superfamily protein
MLSCRRHPGQEAGYDRGMREPREHLLTARQLADGPATAVSHPLNPASEVHIRPLSEKLGLERVRLSMARIPPGKESFIFHAHKGDEEWVYILSGRGQADIGDRTFEVGPGDVMAFPTPSIGHHLRNPYDEDLVYLMGGERGRVEVGEFPKVGKHAIFAADGIYFVDSQHLQKVSFDEYLKK